MKNIFIIIFLLFTGFVFAQSPGTPDIQFQASFRITNAVNGALDTVIISGYVDECAGRFTNSDIAIGDSIYVLEGSDLLVFGAVTTRTISLGIATFKAIDFGGAGILPSNGQAAIFRPTTNYQFPGDICGLNPNLQQYITARFMMRLDEFLSLKVDSLTLSDSMQVVRDSLAAIRADMSSAVVVGDSLDAIPAAETIESTDKLIGNDSTITFQKLINQTRDSLQVDTLIASNTAVAQSTVLGAVKGRKHVGFNLKLTSAESQDEAINLPSVADVEVGTRFSFSVRDSSLNYDYYILPASAIQIKINDRYASRYYFDANEIAVFSLVQSGSEKYWRLESTNSDAFSYGQTIGNILNAATDFNRKRFIRGSRVKTNLGAEYELTNVPVSTYNSNNPDSMFVYTGKDKAPWSKNYCIYSDDVIAGNWILPGTDVQILQNFTPSPTGTMTAERFIYQAATANNMWTSTFSALAGEEWTISYWAKSGIAASNDDAYIVTDMVFGATPAQTVPIDNQWRRYSQTFTVVTPSTDRFVISIVGTEGDSIDITNVQIDFGDVASDYKRTESTVSTEGTLYAVYQPNNGHIEIDNLYQSSVVNNHTFFQKAFNFAASTNIKDKVVSARKNRTFKGEMTMPEHVSLKGTFSGGAVGSDYEKSGTVFTIDLNDATKQLFEFTGGGSGNNQGNTIEGILFVPISPLDAVIYTEQSIDSRIKDVTIDNQINSTKYIDKAIHIGAGSLSVTLDNVDIQDCDIGVLHEGSEMCKILNTSSILTCSIGIQSSGPLSIENIWIEAVDSCAIIQDAATSELVINDLYTESVPNESGSTAPTIHIVSSAYASITNSVLNGDLSVGTGHTLIRLEDAKSTLIQSNKFINSDSVFTTRSGTGFVEVSNNSTDMFLPYVQGADNFVGIYDSTKVVFVNNDGLFSLVTNRKNWIPNTYLFEPKIVLGQSDTTDFIDASIHSNLFLNSPTVKNRNENQFPYSSNIGSNFSVSGSHWTITSNDTIGYEGLTTADKLEKVSGSNWFIRFTSAQGLDTLIAGQEYILSFWAHAGGEAFNNNHNTFEVRFGSVPDVVDTISIDTTTKGWARYSTKVMLIPDGIDQQLIDISSLGGDIGDYNYFDGWQLEKSPSIGKNVNTNGMALVGDSVNPSIIILDGDTLGFKGDVRIDSILYIPGITEGDQPENVLSKDPVTGEIKYHSIDSLVQAINNSGGGIWTENSGEVYPTTIANEVGVGTTDPDRLLHAESSTALTNTVTYPQRLSHVTSGTATTNFGLGIEYEAENASGTNRVIGSEEITYSDAVNATEDATYNLKLIRAGALTTGFTLSSVGSGIFTGSVTAGNYFVGSGGVYRWSGLTSIYCNTDGVLLFYNNAGNDFNRFQFGGTTSSFPSLKRSGTGLICRLADDSANAPFTASVGTFTTEAKFGTDATNGGEIYPYAGVFPGTPAAAGTNLSFFNYNTTATGMAAFAFSGSNLTPTSGTSTDVWVQRTFAPTSGTADYAAITVTPIVNQTGGANGQTYGIVVDPVLTAAADYVGIDVRNSDVVVDGRIASSGKLVTLGVAATTMAINGNVTTVTGDGGGNTIATITGGRSGQIITLIFVDANVTITDDASDTANTVNLSAAFTSTGDDVLTLVFNGTSWNEVCRSIN